MSVPEDEITVGIELEFLIRHLPHSIPRHTEYQLVAEALGPLAEKLEVPVFDMVSSKAANESLPPSKLTAGFKVQGDFTIKLDKEHPIQRSVEVATPILRNGQWRSVIPQMTQILSSEFKLAFNTTTGLHVHIGIGRDYTLRDLKRISKAIVLFEKGMDTHHPACRCPTKDTLDYNPYIRSNREGCSLQGLSDSEMMLEIESALSITLLLTVINAPIPTITRYCRLYKYNLTSIQRFQTVEFRQAIATDDGDSIVSWVDTAIRFIRSAISTPDAEFDAWADAGISDPGVYRRFGVPVPEA